MDTQIRRVASTALVTPVSNVARATLSLPSRSADRSPRMEATAQTLRLAILRCAAQAMTEEQQDTEARLHCFVAKLSGSMECLGEVDLDHALWDLMKMRAEPCRRSDRAADVHAAQNGPAPQ